MLISFFRTLILFVMVVFAIRIMGKRQIGQLQPAELVITILLSEIAATPMQDNDIPMLNSLVAILVLVSLEIFMSAVSLKSMKFRGLLQGNSIVIIKNGKIDQQQMKRLRFTVDDLLEALRQKDVFDVSDVEYAIAETDGSLSVMLKSSKRNVTAEDINIPQDKSGMPVVVIIDGQQVKNTLIPLPVNQRCIKAMIEKSGVKESDIFLMTIDGAGKSMIIKKENS